MSRSDSQLERTLRLSRLGSDDEVLSLKMKLPAALIALFAWATVDATSPWSQMAARNGGIVKLNSASYDRITSTPRNYSVAITLTALPAQYKCQPCR